MGAGVVVGTVVTVVAWVWETVVTAVVAGGSAERGISARLHMSTEQRARETAVRRTALICSFMEKLPYQQ